MLDELLKSAYAVYTFYDEWKETGCVKEIHKRMKGLEGSKNLFEGWQEGDITTHDFIGFSKALYKEIFQEG